MNHSAAFPPYGSFSAQPPQQPGFPEDGSAVMALQRIKRASSSNNYQHQQPQHRFSVASERMNSVASMGVSDEHSQMVFVHRRSERDMDPVIQPPLSSLRGEKDGQDDEIDDDASIKADDDDVAVPGAVPPLRLSYTTGDIVFANGNNREKRRVEVFEYYSKLHKYKESAREVLYDQQRETLQTKIKSLSLPRNFNTEVASLDECRAVELFEQEQDLVELRDSELTRLKYWRRVQRNENLKLFYEDSSKIYKQATDSLDRRLENLKNFFIHQKQLLINLEKDALDIGSGKGTKLYTGFISNDTPTNEDQIDNIEQPRGTEDDDSNPDSSETDTGASSSTQQTTRGSRSLRAPSAPTPTPLPALPTPARVVKRKVGRPRKVNAASSAQPTSKPSQVEKIHTSILDGLAPALTPQEFFLIVGDDVPARHGLSQELASLRGDMSDSDSNTNTDGMKKTGIVRNGGKVDRDGTSAMNRIMKSYTSPDDLKKEEIDQDLAILRYSARY